MMPVLVVVGVLLVFIVVLRHYGKFGNFSAGVGNALFQLNTFVRPTTHNIVEAKKQRKKNDARGDEPPELPPWAQSGS